MIRYLHLLIFVPFLFFFASFTDFLTGEELDQKLKAANQAYQFALSQDSIAKQEQYFNQALALYSEIEEQFDHHKDLGPLYYNLGNIYFYLSEYPLAVTYYYRSLKTRPNDHRVIQNINQALKTLGLQESYTPPILSYFEILTLFGGWTAISILFFSLSIWVKRKLVFLGAVGTGGIAIFFLCTAILMNVTSPIEAVVISPSLLRTGASSDFPPVNELPIFPGRKVDVIDVSREGKWLKVSTGNNEIGYLSYKSLRVI